MGGAMSSMVLSGDTSGTVTVTVPAVAGTNTLTLPAVTGTILTNKSVGTVLQVVSTNYAVATSSTSSTFVSTGLSASITPLFSTSKILIICSTSGSNSAFQQASSFTIFRGTVSGTNLGDATYGMARLYNASSQVDSSICLNYLDSPATTSATTYTMGMRVGSSPYTVTAQLENRTATITLMEIAG